MSLPPLTLVPAGAGSGKTHRIQEALGDWIEAGEIAPERVVAVTFTEAAAAELRERTRARLLAAGRVEDARRLDEAYISTIHGFGLRLLGEFAFEAGLSPRPRKIDDAEEDALVRLALARGERADALTAELGRFGYRRDYPARRGPEDVFRDHVLEAVRLLRTLGGDDPAGLAASLAARAGARLASEYGETGDPAALGDALHRAASALVAAYPDGLAASHGNSNRARMDFRRDHRRLQAALDRSCLDRDWGLWQGLRELRLSKQRAPVPEDYASLGAAVMEAAAGIERHPGPLADAREHLSALLGAGAEVLERYHEDKRAGGLLDFTDMIALAARLLEQPRVIRALAGRVDCLVIDEFQDTNPLQFALLWRLHAAGVPALVVGDLKQAIMGFQGADPRLLEALEAHAGAARAPLTENWRSQPALMQVVNAVGEALFPDGYQRLAPRAPPATLAPLALLEAPAKASRAVQTQRIAEHLAALLADPDARVRDRREPDERALRGADIAVLCPTHRIAEGHAAALRVAGVRARLQEPGWLESRIVQLALTALAYVADPSDRHAALYLAVTELGGASLEAALGRLVDGERLADPLLASLDGLAPQARGWPAGRAVDAVVAALDLHGAIAWWPDAAQARANLLRLQWHAREFEAAERGVLEAAGYHGGDLRTFCAWVGARGETLDGQPPAAVVDEGAVEIVTWHAAKGREWPVVVVSGLDHDVRPRLPELAIEYPAFDRLDRLLERAEVRFTPAYAAAGQRARAAAPLQTAAELEARRLLYVAMTRARDQLVVDWPRDLSGRRSATYWRVLRDAGVTVRDGALDVAGQVFAGEPARARPGHVVGAGDAGPARLGRRALRRGQAGVRRTPDATSPSQDPPAPRAAPPRLLLERFGAGLGNDIGHGIDGGEDLAGAALGTVLHRCFEILGARPDLRDWLGPACGVSFDRAALARIEGAVRDFERWLTARLGPSAVLRETPFLALGPDETVVSGVIDLVVETPSGHWVLDHKSDLVEDPRVAFAGYQGQLEAYADAVAAARPAPLLGVGIHWIRRGEVVLAPVPGA